MRCAVNRRNMAGKIYAFRLPAAARVVVMIDGIEIDNCRRPRHQPRRPEERAALISLPSYIDKVRRGNPTYTHTHTINHTLLLEIVSNPASHHAHKSATIIYRVRGTRGKIGTKDKSGNWCSNPYNYIGTRLFCERNPGRSRLHMAGSWCRGVRGLGMIERAVHRFGHSRKFTT
jgi:hypothetical protein